MAGVLDSLPREGRAAIIRLRSLGDCVLTTPALAILKRARPDLRLAVAVEDRFRAIFEGNPDIDEILPSRIGAVRAWRPALCLNLHGGSRSAWMTALSGARYRAGFGHFRNRFVYNVHIPRAQEILGDERKVHTAEHLASAMFYLGAPRCEIPRAKLNSGWGQPFGAAAALRGGVPVRPQSDGPKPGGGPEGLAPLTYAAIHAVAATLEKTWYADGFLAVAAELKRSGMEPVFLGGPGDDLSPFRAYRTLAGAPLSEVKALLSGAALFVGNDSGPAHMAAAFGIPSVVIFGSSDPAIWGPWRAVSEIVTAPGGIREVKTERVLAALDRLKAAA